MSDKHERTSQDVSYMISNHFRSSKLHALTEGATFGCGFFSWLPFVSLAFGFGGVPAAFALCSAAFALCSFGTGFF
jgi:hypothetical protein